MHRTSFVVAIVIFILLAVCLLRACVFLAPLHVIIWRTYRRPMLEFGALLLANLWAACYAVLRRALLKDTGAKLAHLEKQLRGRATIATDLTERILERR